MPSGASPAARLTVAINARAAVREQIGGVERFAGEMASRLPALRPDRYRMIRPPAGLAHRLGHVWEQLVLLPALARRARLLITVSEFSKGELAEALDVAPERIAVVPAGVGERFRPGPGATSVLERYGLHTPYALVVGTVSARKNLGILGRAADALRDRGVELVAAGSDRGYLRAGDVPIRRLGYVPDDDLPALYAGAGALAMPSRYEGFGLPCLEAMACGTPVVAAAAGALPETVGDAALLVDPGDPDAFAEAIVTAACDRAAREPLIDAGLRRAESFTWKRAAELTDATIGRLLCSEGRA